MRILKKILSLSVTALGVLLISGFLSLKPIAQTPAMAQFASSCKDIKLITTAGAPTNPVLSVGGSGRPAGVADSGQLDFNAPDLLIGTKYQACMQEMAEDWAPGDLSTGLGLNGRLIQGWTWNTNLGYVSFSCKGGTNAGANCGSTNYGSILDPATSPGGYKLQGFAWGDNIGWISMNCESGKNLGMSCGGIDYGVKVAKFAETSGAGCPDSLNRGDLYGYAWANSVGWMNFCGAHIDIGPEMGASVEYVSSTGEDVFANGTDNYKILVKILEDSTPLTSLGAHSVEVTNLTWSNLPRSDQVTGTDRDAATTPLASSFTWGRDGFTALVSGNLLSIAPTGGDYDALTLESIEVTIDGVPQTYTLNHSFVFEPAVAVTNVNSIDPPAPDGTITTKLNAAQDVQLIAKRNAPIVGNPEPINLISVLHDCLRIFNYKFVNADGSDIWALTDIPSTAVCAGRITNTHIQPLSAAETTSILEHVYTIGDPASAAAFGRSNSMGMQTIVAYTVGARLVKYNSKKALGGLLNQAADVRGNVRLDIASTSGLPAGGLSQSLGEYAKSKREKFYRAIKNVIKIAPTPEKTGGTDGRIVLDSSKLGAGKGNARKGLYYFNKENLRSPAGSDSCTVILNQAGAINFSGANTIFAEGCDVFIDQNIVASSGRLGIIALEDLSTGKGGNVYICNRVTDVEANIVADGSLFSYGDLSYGACDDTNKITYINSDGTPNFGSANLFEVLKNQLTLKGSLTSNNTYGGSTATQQLTCDGSRASSESDRRLARLCDINFLRYARTRDPRAGENPLNSPRACWADGTALSELIGGDCNTNYPGLNGIGRSIVNILYRAPDKAMQIFNAVK